MNKTTGNMCKNDWYIVAVILLIALLVFLLQFSTDNREDKKVFVYNDKNLLYSIDFKQLQNPFNKTFSTDKYSIELEFDQEKGIKVVKSSCPDKTCQYSGYINKGKQTIVCLPAKIYIQIQIQNNNGGVDATVY